LERCGPQVQVGSDFVGEMWVTGLSWEGFRWKTVGDRFKLGVFRLDRYGQQVQVGRVVV
jgi:hypothetical protein